MELAFVSSHSFPAILLQSHANFTLGRASAPVAPVPPPNNSQSNEPKGATIVSLGEIELNCNEIFSLNALIAVINLSGLGLSPLFAHLFEYSLLSPFTFNNLKK